METAESDVKKLHIECELDEHYQALYESAMKVAESYLRQARAAAKASERDVKVHFLISVRVRSPGCWSATWSKSIWVRDTPKSLALAKKTRPKGNFEVGRSHTSELPKGKDTTYPAKSFRVLPMELRAIAIYHEKLLAGLRKAALDNRLQKRAFLFSKERSEKAVANCTEGLEALALAASALYENEA